MSNDKPTDVLLKTTNPFFSVIIPLYNKADTILRTLASVEAQTFRDFEVIIINDGSKDNSAEIVQNSRFIHQYRMVSQPNKGVSAARNMGVAMAKGTYLAFLDADDEWDAYYLSEMARLIEKCPEAGVYGSSNQRGFMKKNGYSDYFREACFYMPCSNTSGLVFPRHVFCAYHGFDETKSFYEDVQLVFKIALKEKVAIYRDVIYTHHHDAKERLTTITKTHGFTPDLLPHNFVIDNELKKGEATPSIKQYARWEIRRLLSRNILNGNEADNLQVCTAFPHMCACVPELKWYAKSRICVFFCWLISKYMAFRLYMAKRFICYT